MCGLDERKKKELANVVIIFGQADEIDKSLGTILKLRQQIMGGWGVGHEMLTNADKGGGGGIEMLTSAKNAEYYPTSSKK